MPYYSREVVVEYGGALVSEIVDSKGDDPVPAIDAFLLRHPEIDPVPPYEQFEVTTL